MVDGRWLMRDRRIVAFDEAAAIAAARDAIGSLRERTGAMVHRITHALPGLVIPTMSNRSADDRDKTSQTI
jgi:hypothetical protein